MTIETQLVKVTGTTLESLSNLFVLTCRTDGKSPKTVSYYRDNLARLLWYARSQDWPEDIRDLTEWHIRGFLDYVATATNRWGVIRKRPRIVPRKGLSNDSAPLLHGAPSLLRVVHI